MIIISDIENLEWKGKPGVITLGDFDGFHLGHRSLLEHSIRRAREMDSASLLVTYHPSPKMLLGKRRFDEQIYTKSEKIFLLQEYNLDAVVFIPFEERLLNVSAKTFLQEILLKKLQARHIILGYDHHFGKNRRGNFRYLQNAATKYHFTTEELPRVLHNGEAISSSAIRLSLKAGEIEKANAMLGRPFFVSGTVIHGNQRGRLLGTPTANLHINPDKILPREGVYAGHAFIGKRREKAVFNIGFNPTFNNIDLSLEAHILDISENLYGEPLRVELLWRLRDEQKFENVDALKARITEDVRNARELFSSWFPQ